MAKQNRQSGSEASYIQNKRCRWRQAQCRRTSSIVLDATDNERGLMGMLSKTKFTLAFTNRVGLNAQTYPKREYITGRWTDSLASGAIIDGISPLE